MSNKIAKQAIEAGRVKAGSSKQPQMPLLVCPGRGLNPTPGDISRIGGPQRPIDSGISRDGLAGIHASEVDAADQGPFQCGRIELPQVVEKATIAVGIEAVTPKEPEMAAVVSPTRRPLTATGDVSGGGRSQCAVDSGLAFLISRDRAASAHPGPFGEAIRSDCN